MNSQWKAFLQARSAKIDDQGNVRFPNAPTAADCALCDLSQLGLIGVSGADTEGFLQGQLTNDVRELSDAHTQLSSHCSPKGRMLANFRVIRLDDTFYLQLPRTKLDALLARLRMFVMRSKVTLVDASDTVSLVGIAGECAPHLLAEHFPTLPEQTDGMTRHGAMAVMRIAGSTPRFEVLGPQPDMQALWETLESAAIVVNADFWTLLDIRAGIPHIYPETSDAFVPQMTNMQLIDGVSFTKGCYTGQEVVARMQYLGKLKRRMYLAEVETDTPPRPGDELYSPSSTSEQSAGRVVDARPSGEGHYELLAVVEVAAAGAGDIRLGSGSPLSNLKEPPYGFPPQG